MKSSRRITLLSLCLWLSLLSPLAARSLIWQVDGPQGTVYLMGSIHWLKPSDYPLDAAFNQSYRKAGKVYFESDLRELAKPEAGQKLLKKAQYPAGSSLKTALSPAVYRQTQAAGRRLGLKSESLERYKPWFAGMILTQTQLARAGYAPEHGIDNHFCQLAVRDRKPIVGFESLDEQLAFLDGLPDQEALLRMTLAELNLAEREIRNLVGAFKRGDAAAVERFIKVRDLSGFEETILTRRTKAWQPRVENLLKRPGATLVIVGAGHLVGENGLVRLLEQAGYQPRQL